MTAYVLCVDDDRFNLEILSALLAEHEVATAKNGQECLDSVAQRKPDLIILDVEMPVMNGLDACRALKADPDTRGVPVLMFSAGAFTDNIKAGLDAGADGYLTKPIRPDELMKKVGEILAGL